MADQAKRTRGGNGLDRSVGMFGLTFYGIGTILGAGIFVVIGEVIGRAGALSPLAYMLAATVAVTTALSFAETAARVPAAGGPIDYMEEAFGLGWLAALIGWVLVLANIVSGATITTGFVSYLGAWVVLPDWMPTVGLIALLALVASAGMKESAWFMAVTTIIGLAVLALIVWINRDGLLASPGAMAGAFRGGGEAFEGSIAFALMGAAFLAVYSFIGFGDMAQTAEEVENVKTALPRAMILALVVVFAAYLLVSMAVTGTGETGGIAEARAPLVASVERHGWTGWPFILASLLIIVNGGLTQIIAAARLLFDLSRDGYPAPAILARVNARTDTPIAATLASAGVALVLALLVPLGRLAQATSLAILIVFFAVNAALFVLKRRDQPENVPDIWIGWPVLGMLFCAGAVIGQVVLWLT